MGAAVANGKHTSSKLANGKPVAPVEAEGEEENYPEVRTVGIVQHPQSKQWAAVMIVTRGDSVVQADALAPHNSVELARIDAKELLLATIYKQD